MCPVLLQGPVRGGFRLTYTGSDPLSDNYRVDDVKCRVRRPSDELVVTGSGTYRVGGQFARQQELTLDLQVGSGPVQRFDSGLVREIDASTGSIYWSGDPAVQAHDVVWGSLRGLQSNGGDFSVSVSGCLADNLNGDAASLPAGDPPIGEGFFFLLRDVETTMADSFDSGAYEQLAPSDDAIVASPVACQ